MRPSLLLLIGACVAPATSSAQCSADRTASSRARLVFVGSAADDSMRLGALTGTCWGSGTLLRSSISLSSFPDSAGFHWTAVAPQVATTWNSQIPVGFNDGSLWAGRGLNATVSGGAIGSLGRLRFIVAPRVSFSQNKPFPTIASGRPDRSAFASPWHSAIQSADLPLRFGTERYTTIDPGETTVESWSGPVALGLTSASAWWGPGIQNALLLSDNAGGIPQAYVRTAKPLATPLGMVEATYLLGQLTESPFFDFEKRNDIRALNAAAVTLRLAADTGLRIGLARAVYSSLPRTGALPEHVADVLLYWHRQPRADSSFPPREQITSLFARWTIPGTGLEAHAEWAKLLVPRSLRDFFVDPQQGQGYTVGFEWARPLSTITTLRVSSEFTSLEQTPPATGAETNEFYTSDLVLQGYTQHGQSIGAAIGPGSSSQYVGATLYRGRYQFGTSLGRIRWEQDAYYRPPSSGTITYHTHDVSLYVGLSAAADYSWGQVDGSVTRTRRMNFLFQTDDPFSFHDDFDVGNNTLSLRVTPRLSRSGK